MGNESRRTAFSAAIFAVIVIGLLTWGGLYVRGLIANAFDTSNKLAAARALDYNSLRYMLDEETGLRGYQTTGQPEFIRPFNIGRANLAPVLAQLRASLPGLHLSEAEPLAADLTVLAAQYLQTVAGPLHRFPDPSALADERAGKRVVDAFRVDVRKINDIITRRQEEADRSARAAIDRIFIFTGLAVLLVLIASLAFFTLQTAAAKRLEDARLNAESERREADVLRSAYLAEKRIADTLQEAFVQRPLPSHPTFRFSATYVPASEEAKVGGDWYDALELPGNRVLFAIGDVTGHGIAAAVTMNRVRQALISSALLDPMPAALLERVARELYRDKTPLVTAVAGFADSSTYEFVYATAGHPPPLLIEPGRAPRMLDCGSLPLGAMLDNDYRTFRIQSVPGAMLVLYTDGAIEHSKDVIAGEQILLEAAAEAVAQTPIDPATFIHNKVFEGRPIGDDVAILTIGFAVEPALGVRISADRAGESAFTGRIGATPLARGSGPGRAENRLSSHRVGKKVA